MILACSKAFRPSITCRSAPSWFQLYTFIRVRVLYVWEKKIMNVCVDPLFSLNQQNSPSASPAYYLFKGSGTGAELLEWNLFTATFCPLMEGLTLLRPIRSFVYSFISLGFGAFIPPTPCRPLAHSQLRLPLVSLDAAVRRGSRLMVTWLRPLVVLTLLSGTTEHTLLIQIAKVSKKESLHFSFRRSSVMRNESYYYDSPRGTKA